MSVLVVVLLGLVALIPSVTGLPRTARPLRRLLPVLHRAWAVPVAQLVLLAAAGLAAVAAPEPGVAVAGVCRVVAVLAAGGGASPVVRAAFRVARRVDPVVPPPHELLHGGAMIGVLERASVTITLLAGWPQGLVVVLAVKGLARYPELREARAGELFIIGTFVSVLWALACFGTARALLT